MMRFYLERCDDDCNSEEYEGIWITLPMGQDDLDKILEEFGIVAEEYNFFVNELEDEQIKGLQTKLPVEDLSELNKLADVFETLDEKAVEKVNRLIKNRDEVSASDFFELIQNLNYIDEDEE
jgi:hypothetical protein